jgi:hypothetical protein
MLGNLYTSHLKITGFVKTEGRRVKISILDIISLVLDIFMKDHPQIYHQTDRYTVARSVT